MPSGCQPFGRCARVGRVEPELSCAATVGVTASERPIANATSMAMRRAVDVMTVLGAVVVRGSVTLPRPVLQPRNRQQRLGTTRDIWAGAVPRARDVRHWPQHRMVWS